jgi:hypothetical protein
MTPDERDLPALSVILVTPTAFGTLRSAVRNLTRQAADESIELLLAGPEALESDMSERDRDDLSAFSGWQHVVVPVGCPFDEARAAAVRVARAPLVAFSEDHCFPQPGWARALTNAFAGGWTGVGPVVENGNPQSAVSWANILLEYGPWMPPRHRGAAAHIPGHNSAYRRDVLLSLGDDLPRMIEAESLLHWHLGRQGHRFAIEPAARTRHINFSKFWASMELRFHGGRQFAARRAFDWPLSRRFAYAALSPLIPAVRLVRLLGLPVVTSRPARFAAVLPAVAVSLFVAAVGECVGYVTRTPGSSNAYLTDIESDRQRFLRAGETEGDVR